MRKLRYGLVGGLLAFPFGLIVGDYAVELDVWVALMGTKWTAYRSAVSATVMIGFALGISICPQNNAEKEEDGEQLDSFY